MFKIMKVHFKLLLLCTQRCLREDNDSIYLKPLSFDMLLHVVIEGFGQDNVRPLGPLVMAYLITDPSDSKSTWMGWNYIGVWNENPRLVISNNVSF